MGVAWTWVLLGQGGGLSSSVSLTPPPSSAEIAVIAPPSPVHVSRAHYACTNRQRGITCTASAPHVHRMMCWAKPWGKGHYLVAWLQDARRKPWDMGATVRGRSVVCAMVIPFTAWKDMHFTVEWVGGSTKPPQYTRTLHAPRIVLPKSLTQQSDRLEHCCPRITMQSVGTGNALSPTRNEGGRGHSSYSFWCQLQCHQSVQGNLGVKTSWVTESLPAPLAGGRNMKKKFKKASMYSVNGFGPWIGPPLRLAPPLPLISRTIPSPWRRGTKETRWRPGVVPPAVFGGKALFADDPIPHTMEQSVEGAAHLFRQHEWTARADESHPPPATHGRPDRFILQPKSGTAKKKKSTAPKAVGTTPTVVWTRALFAVTGRGGGG